MLSMYGKKCAKRAGGKKGAPLGHALDKKGASVD